MTEITDKSSKEVYFVMDTDNEPQIKRAVTYLAVKTMVIADFVKFCQENYTLEIPDRVVSDYLKSKPQ